MNQFLIWFALVYGNLNALVAGVVGLAIWAGGATGTKVCADWGMGVTSCRVTLVSVFALVLGTSTILSFKRLLDIHKGRAK